MKNQDKKPALIGLDELVAEKLSQRMLANIDLVTVEVADIAGPGIGLKITKKSIKVHIDGEVSTKKLIGWFGGGFAAIIGATLTFFGWLIPILIDYFHKPPP